MQKSGIDEKIGCGLNDVLMEESRVCMEHGAHLLTLDSHFSAIEGLLLTDL